MDEKIKCKKSSRDNKVTKRITDWTQNGIIEFIIEISNPWVNKHDKVHINEKNKCTIDVVFT